MFHVKQFDVIVVGGGHAGCEAAAVSARMGVKTALITLKTQSLGVMSCNPAIGGLGKGHLVREIDAMDGLMGVAADQAGIQFRLLNRSKGPAVQGPRMQADRALYKSAIQKMLTAQDCLTIIEGEVVDFQMEESRIVGVLLADGSNVSAGAVVLTAGTFLNGVIHIGRTQSAGGRVGDLPSIRLAKRLSEFDLARGRLKTGTPPRLDGKTIDWDILDKQFGDDVPTMLSFMSKGPVAAQVSCGVTETNESTHEIVRENLSQSAMYGGNISGVGPRYCPSIEDKIVRFSDKSSHQIFLEPEGLNDSTVYPNGISTSLPAEVQEQYVRSIKGLKDAVILQPGYAIEYDFFDPRCLGPNLALKGYGGLFFAGQINGTTGYEEAAAQGIVAGLNAAQYALGEEEILFSRADSYIGVMIDDLVTRGVTEPYRMFTSRAEYRLLLRADNADQRLTPKAISIGCVSDFRRSRFETKMENLNTARTMLEDVSFTPTQLSSLGFSVRQDGARRSGFAIISQLDATPSEIASRIPGFPVVEPSVLTQLWRDSLYSNYTDRQKHEADMLRRDEDQKIPSDFDYSALPGLSNELRAKLIFHRPTSISHAGRIEGMTPAALVLLLSRLRGGLASRQAH